MSRLRTVGRLGAGLAAGPAVFVTTCLLTRSIDVSSGQVDDEGGATIQMSRFYGIIVGHVDGPVASVEAGGRQTRVDGAGWFVLPQASHPNDPPRTLSVRRDVNSEPTMLPMPRGYGVAVRLHLDHERYVLDAAVVGQVIVGDGSDGCGQTQALTLRTSLDPPRPIVQAGYFVDVAPVAEDRWSVSLGVGSASAVSTGRFEPAQQAAIPRPNDACAARPSPG